MEKLTKQIEINSGHIDPNIADFSRSFIQNSKAVEHSIEVVSQKRPELTPLHFGLLVYSAYKYSYLVNENFMNNSVISWDYLLNNSSPNFTSILDDALRYKNVNITTPARYGAINLAISKLFEEKDVDLCDVGCGFYPSGINNVRSPHFPDGENNWSRGLITQLKNKDINIRYITAIDLNKLDVDWTASCLWTPLNKLTDTRDQLQKKLDVSNGHINFHVADITNESVTQLIKPSSQDVISMANVMYQLTSEMRQKAFNNVSKLLKLDGWFLSLEYLEGGSRRRPFTYGITGYQKTSDGCLQDGKLIMTLDSADCDSVKF
ncbi:MAG: hypothetical protein ACD_19C00079G0013 [uncultured bacterium]|nr:MAG: hypothetical protein ACD_19C00079G0013 [uncultured bacterium]